VRNSLFFAEDFAFEDFAFEDFAFAGDGLADA
jgi:hypothetical protein